MFLSVLLLVLCRPRSEIDVPAEMVVFDAGQGLAVSMSWGDQYWLYDTGLSFGAYSLVESAIFPYFREQENLHRISGLIVSHGDMDHAGGAARVSEYLHPREIWSGQVGRVEGLKGEEPCVSGTSWQHAGGVMEVLYPFDELGLGKESSNNHSCVIRFTYKGYIFLIMGDLEGQAEMALVERYREELKADVLVAGHHGAADASSIALLKHVLPRYVVVSAGYLNRFGHPHKDVINRADFMGAKLLNTASLGAIRFSIDEVLELGFAREERAAYWLQPVEDRESK
jgi:competence protein ComEC